MTKAENVFDIKADIEADIALDLEKTITGLQELGLCLKNSISRLPDCTIKEYLMFETSNIIEFKTAQAFYYLQNKILRMMNLVIKWDLGGEILKLLEEISVGVRKIVRYVEGGKRG